MKTFDHYCEYRKTPNGVVLSPIQVQKWLVLFCDEINLPDEDKFGERMQVHSVHQSSLTASVSRNPARYIFHPAVG